jgi:phage/plasmid-associated DNA primase
METFAMSASVTSSIARRFRPVPDALQLPERDHRTRYGKLPRGQERRHDHQTLPCPTWDAFLEEIMADDKSMIRYLQKAVGYSATGSTREQCFFLCWGGGNNGKTTFLETIRTTIGEYYASQIPMDSLMVKKFDTGQSNDIASLQGIRFVTAVESTKGKRLDER